MAEFLNKKKLLEWIPKIIETAEKEVIIISPYIQVSEKIFSLLKDAEKRGVEITLIYKEGELSDKEKNKFNEIENLNLLYHSNLHSKCLYNEKYLMITSMNLYEYSQRHNRKMGILFRRTDESTNWDDYRNSLVGDFFKELKLTEGRASGFPTIYDSMEDNVSPKPVFKTDDDFSFFLCTLPINAFFIKLELTDREKAILKFCINSKKRSEILEYLDLKNLHANYVRNILPLIERGLLDLTIPQNPTSPRQEYFTTEVGKDYL